MIAYRSTLFLTLTLLAASCAAHRETVRPEAAKRTAPSPSPTPTQHEVRYTDEGVGFPILPFALSTKTGISPPDIRVVPEEAGFWEATNGNERRWTVERRDGNLVAFHENDTQIEFATFRLNEGRHGNAFELTSATLFDAAGKPLVKFTADHPIPDLARQWRGKFATDFSIESHAKAASYDGKVEVEKDTDGTTIRFFRDNMLSGRTPLFAVRMTTTTDGSFVLGRP